MKIKRNHCSAGAAAVLALGLSTPAVSVCTDVVTIKEFHIRASGWIHITAEGMTNMDIFGSGATGMYGMLLNYNGATGVALEGKKMLYAALLKSQATGGSLRLCSNGCDAQHFTFTSLDFIDAMR